ncbi:MAG: YceI family protein [Pseudomonadota bacterium]
MKSQIAAAAVALSTLEAVPTVAAAAPVTWEVDSGHSTAQFKVRHLMVSNVRGALGPVTGTVQIDEKDIARSRVTVSIDARGIDTREPKRDEHLRSADFLDVAQHPTITFRSTSVRATSVRAGKAGALEVTGDLTIRGITKSVTLAVDALPPAIKDPWGNTKRGAVARASINRKDWGLVWNMALETGGVVVGERIDIEIEVELLQRVPAANDA